MTSDKKVADWLTSAFKAHVAQGLLRHRWQFAAQIDHELHVPVVLRFPHPRTKGVMVTSRHVVPIETAYQSGWDVTLALLIVETALAGAEHAYAQAARSVSQVSHYKKRSIL